MYIVLYFTSPHEATEPGESRVTGWHRLPVYFQYPGTEPGVSEAVSGPGAFDKKPFFRKNRVRTGFFNTWYPGTVERGWEKSVFFRATSLQFRETQEHIRHHSWKSQESI